MNIEQYLEQEVQFTPSVIGYLVKEGKVLLGLRKKVSLGLGEYLIAGIGGKLEEGETNENAFDREVKEEIGVQIVTKREMGQVKFIHINKPNWYQNVTIYVSDEWKGEPNETEPIKPIWFSKTELPIDRMWEDNNYWLPDVLNGKRVNGIFLYDQGKIVEHKLEVNG